MRYLADSNVWIRANDLFIASIARAHNLTVATGNDDEFSRVPGLSIENWTS